MAGQVSRKEIYTYQAPWTAYSMSWCRSTDDRNKFKIAVGSYKEEYSNHLSIIQLQSVQTNKGGTSVGPQPHRTAPHFPSPRLYSILFFSYCVFSFNLPTAPPRPNLPPSFSPPRWGGG